MATVNDLKAQFYNEQRIASNLFEGIVEEFVKSSQENTEMKKRLEAFESVETKASY